MKSCSSRPWWTTPAFSWNLLMCPRQRNGFITFYPCKDLDTTERLIWSDSCESVSCSVLSNSLHPINYSQLGSSVYGILQARILEWVTIPFSRRPSRPKDWTQVSCIVGRFFTIWTTREVLHLYNTTICKEFQSITFDICDTSMT